MGGVNWALLVTFATNTLRGNISYHPQSRLKKTLVFASIIHLNHPTYEHIKNSYFMAKLLMVLMSVFTWATLSAQGTDATVTLDTTGKLAYEIDMLEATRINTLTIKGKLGAEDLKVLRSASGKLATVNTLDLSETELVEDESLCYASLYGGVTASNTYLYDDYYISNRPRTETATGETDLGVGVVTTRHFVNDFSAVFNGTQAYRKIIMPALPSIGEELISGNKVVEEIVIPEGARFVGTGAFAKASSLKKVILPMSVNSVGTHAFLETTCMITVQSHLHHIGYGAFRKSAITEIDLSEVKSLGESAFEGSSLAGELDLSGIVVIPDYAFQKTSVTKAILSPAVTEIGDYAFASTPLADINLPESGTEIGNRAFYDTPWIYNNVVADAYGIKYICNTAYEAVASAMPSEVTIADGTTALAADLFAGSKVIKVNLPQTVRVIGENAFKNCKLTEITWPESLEEIRDKAFQYCSSLWFDSFPDKLRSIGRSAFYGCTGLTEITFPENLERVGYDAFKGCSTVSLVRLNSANASMKVYLANLTRLTVGPKVELIEQISSPKLRMVQFAPRDAATPLVIGDNAFGSTVLEECLLPDNTVSIGSRAFDYAKNVNIGKFPSKVRHVGAYAFEGVETPCEITELQVDSIGDFAFAGWTGLSKIILPSGLKYLGKASLDGTSIEEIHLPIGVMDTELPISPFRAGIYSTGCPKLKKVTCEPGFKTYNITLRGTGVEELVVPDGVTSIIAQMPSGLKTLSLPAECLDVTKYMFIGSVNTHVIWRGAEESVFDGDPYHILGERWYADNRAGHDLILPEGFGVIEKAFYYSTIGRLSIPSTVYSIASDVFNSSNLDFDVIEFRGSRPPRSSDGRPLYVGKDVVVKVPFGTSAAYKGLFGPNTNIVETTGTLTLSLDQDVYEWERGVRFFATAIVDPEYIEMENYRWSSSDPAVATIRGDGHWGEVTMEGDGECTITVTAEYAGKEYNATAIVTTGVSSLDSVIYDSNPTVDIYTPSGITIAIGADREYFSSLPAGVYIVNGRTVLKK